MNLQWLQEEYIQKRLHLMRAPLQERLSKVISIVSQEPEVAFIVFDIEPGFAFEKFPVTITTYNKSRVELDTRLHCQELLPGRIFLESKYDYPLGRADFFGADTTRDWQLVFDEIVGFLVDIWSSLRPPEFVPISYAGHVATDTYHNVETSMLTNLETGERELVNLIWVDH